jgi:hypothetical protein
MTTPSNAICQARSAVAQTMGQRAAAAVTEPSRLGRRGTAETEVDGGAGRRQRSLIAADADRIRDTLPARWDTDRDAARAAATVVLDRTGSSGLRRPALSRAAPWRAGAEERPYPSCTWCP